MMYFSEIKVFLEKGKVFLGQDKVRCKVQAYIYIYSLHLAPKLKY